MKTFRFCLLIPIVFALGCTSPEMRDFVAKSSAVARVAVVDQPKAEDLAAWIKANAEAWEQVEIYVGLKETK